MPPRSLNRREYGEFKQMLQRALRDIRLPGGIIDSDHIVPGSINPTLCMMDANWEFRGRLTSNSIELDKIVSINRREVQELQSQQTTEKQNEEIIELRESAPASTEDVYFLDARTNKTVLTLPLAAKNVGRKIYVKRIDQDTTKICRVVTSEKDTIDDASLIELTAKDALILIASSKQWHVFSNL